MESKPPQHPASAAGTGGYTPPVASADLQARYAEIANDPARTGLKDQFLIPARAGKAFKVLSGELLRVCCIEGPQVADFNVFNAQDPLEKFWAARTRVAHGCHLKVGDRLWSVPPHTRPMMTIIKDTVSHGALPFGARSHDLLYSRCDRRHFELVFNRKDAPNCNDNLARAIAEFGVTAEHVHDPFNMFMTTGVNDEGRPFYLPSAAKQGDYLELIAEMDCLVAVSACPGGSSGPVNHPLEVQIFSAPR
jgi:uncharacterized protein YcgI (DUF1989 family)